MLLALSCGWSPSAGPSSVATKSLLSEGLSPLRCNTRARRPVCCSVPHVARLCAGLQRFRGAQQSSPQLAQLLSAGCTACTSRE